MKHHSDWKKRVNAAFIIIGILLLLGGLLLHGVNVHISLRLPTPTLLPWASVLLGVVFIILGVSELFFKKTKEMEIEEKDERNIMLSNAAKADAYEVMTLLFALTLTGLAIFGYLTTAIFFIFFSVFIIAQGTFVARLWYLHKKM